MDTVASIPACAELNSSQSMQPYFHPSRQVLRHHVIIKWCLRNHVQLSWVLSRLRMRPGCDTQQFTVTASSLSSLWRSNFLTEKDDIWRTKLSEYAFIREVSQIYTLDKEHPCTNVLRGEIKNFVSVTYFLVYHVCSALCDCHRVAWQWPIDLVYGKSLWNDAGIDLIYLAKRVSDETWKNTP